MEDALQVRGRDLDEKTPSSSIDPNLFHREDRSLREEPHLLSRPEGRSPTDLVTGVTIGDLGLTRRNAFAADLPSELLGRNLAVAVHENDERFLRLVFHDERLDHRVLGDAELSRRMRRPALFLVAEEMGYERHIVFSEHVDRRSDGVFHLGFHYVPSAVSIVNMAKLDSKSRIKMNDGRSIPILGLGVYQSRPGKTTVDAVRAALELGYRHVDTASMYGNEADVGRAVRECGIPRKDVFVTTKLWNDDHGYDEAMRAFDSSVIELGLEYVDLYLIHWPVPKLRLDSWRAMKEIAKSGRAKSIGVSNYTIKHLEELADRLGDVPAVNQVEFSPFLFQRDLLDYCAEKKIVIEAYSPLTRGKRLKDRRVAKVAESLGKSPAQVLLRWCLEKGLVVLPKSTHRERIEENGEIFDFEMSEGDLAVLDDLNEDLHVSWDPTNQK